MTAFYNDTDEYCCRVLRERIDDGQLPAGHVDQRDIRDVAATELRGFDQWHLFAGIGGFPLGLSWAGVGDDTRILTAGFPCQPFSSAGKRTGTDDDRWLWPVTAWAIGIVRPELVLLENVPRLLSMDGGRVFGGILADLDALGFNVQWHCVPASHVGAPHIRDRVWISAHADGVRVRDKPGRRGRTSGQVEAESVKHGPLGNVADTGGRGFAHSGTEPAHRHPREAGTQGGRDWGAEPGIRRVAHGIPHRVDRLRALGNAVVPQVVEYIMENDETR